MTRIFLADDHPMIQAAVRSLLHATDYQLVGTASSGTEAIDAIAANDPELVVLDVQMPGGSGIDVLRSLRSASDARKVVLLTASIEDRHFAEALSLEVDGVLLKSSDPGLLLECLDAVRDGRSWIDPALRERAVAAKDHQPPVSLSPRERELVALVREGLRNKDIAERLGVTEGTVKVYMHAVFDKTGVGNRTELAIRAPELIGSPG